jgi:hypothetical protein
MKPFYLPMSMFKLSSIFSVIFLLFWALSSGCEDGSDMDLPDHAAAINQNGSIVVSAGEYDLQQSPMSVAWDGPAPACLESNGERTPVQFEESEGGHTVLWFSAEVPAGEIKTFHPTDQEDCAGPAFLWESGDDASYRLSIDGVPGIEYHFPEFDMENYEETMKPFHHVFAPDGSRLITKGIGGTYTHHRGIFYGYNHVRIGEDGESMNLWSAREDRGEVTQHRDFLREWTGPVFGGHEIEIEWKDTDGEVFAEEIRQIKVFRRSNGELLIDVKSDLTSRVNELQLDGDLHHAGIQFRASQYVDDHPEHSRFLRPEGWEDYPADEEIDDPENYTDLSWNAFQFMVEGEPYTVGYFSHPGNPSGGEMSERLYGRFGEFIPGMELDEGETLTLRYRFLIISGHEIDRERMEQEYSVYAGS